MDGVVDFVANNEVVLPTGCQFKGSVVSIFCSFLMLGWRNVLSTNIASVIKPLTTLCEIVACA